MFCGDQLVGFALQRSTPTPQVTHGVTTTQLTVSASHLQQSGIGSLNSVGDRSASVQTTIGFGRDHEALQDWKREI